MDQTMAKNDKIITGASFGLRVLSLSASVCVCVSVYRRQPPACPRDNSSHVQAIQPEYPVL